MKKVKAIISLVVIGIVLIGMIAFSVMHIAQNGFNMGALPVIIVGGIGGLIIGIKTICKN